MLGRTEREEIVQWTILANGPAVVELNGRMGSCSNAKHSQIPIKEYSNAQSPILGTTITIEHLKKRAYISLVEYYKR
ncbi:MAG: hypothetical protein JKY48_09125 [Flavobacteriales bacterium]|nr:hypothetical protein [Flavobacteriales bacterium]